MSEKIENVVKDCVLHKDVLSQPLAITLYNDATDRERLICNNWFTSLNQLLYLKSKLKPVLKKAEKLPSIFLYFVSWISGSLAQHLPESLTLECMLLQLK